MDIIEGCRCTGCAVIHAEFIGAFGKWPDMSHEEAQALQRRRDESEASWAQTTT